MPVTWKSSTYSNQDSPSNSTILSKINQIFEVLEVMNSKLDALVEKNKFFRGKIDSLESRIAKLQSIPTALPDKSNFHNEILNEIQDRISREKNVLIFNVSEP